MKAFVTGAGGFLGGAISRYLIQQGCQVKGIARSKYPAMEALGVEMIQGDICDEALVKSAVQGCDVVFHVAAKPGVWGPYEEYYQADVVGTENIIKACLSAGIKKLVYTSSPSVAFSGEDENGVNESHPYPASYLCHYAATKAEAEQKVLAANGADLATCSLRPHLIWGPGDNHLVPRLISRAKSGKLKIIGNGQNLVDSTYIDNAVQAHILAAESLAPGSKCAGKAYYISNGEPLPMRDLINRILSAANLGPVTKQVPAKAAYYIGGMLEVVYTLLRKTDEPILTRFVAKQLAKAHWYDIGAAERDFNYKPTISINEGIDRLRQAI